MKPLEKRRASDRTVAAETTSAKADRARGSGITKYEDREPPFGSPEYARAIREMAAGRTFNWHLETANWERLAREIVAASTPQEIEQEQTPANYASRILRYLDSARRYVRKGDADLAAAHALAAGWLLAEARIKFAHEAHALLGEKFTAGRKPGSSGPIRKAIARALREDPEMTNPELWDRLRLDPPRGWIFYDNSRRGRYIEGPKAKDGMKYARFLNIASEERAKLKG